MYNVVFISGVQQSDSVMHIHVAVLFQILFHYRSFITEYWADCYAIYAVSLCWSSILYIVVCADSHVILDFEPHVVLVWLWRNGWWWFSLTLVPCWGALWRTVALVSVAKLHILHHIPGHERDSDSSHIKKAARRSWIARFHYHSFLNYPFDAEEITDLAAPPAPRLSLSQHSTC